MKHASLFTPLRRIVGLGLAAAALSCASNAFAGTYSYQVVNDTLSGGDAIFPVTDDLTFTNLQLNETFFDGFTTSVDLKDFNNATQTSLDTGATELDSNPFTLSDPVHGALSDAVLTGSLTISGLIPGPSLDLTLQPTLDPASQFSQSVSTSFTTELLGPLKNGVAVGTFSLLDSTGDPFISSKIEAAPVPEASSYISLGLMLLLGGLVVMRRRGVSANVHAE